MFSTLIILASIGQSPAAAAGILVARVHAAAPTQAKAAVPGKKTQAEINALARKERERAIAKKQAGKAAAAAQAMSSKRGGLSLSDRDATIANMTGIRICAGKHADGSACKVPVAVLGNGFCPQHGGM
jgi:hypothetical protein